MIIIIIHFQMKKINLKEESEKRAGLIKKDKIGKRN